MRDTFAAVGFSRVDGASDKEFTFRTSTSDFDDIFVLENVVVLAEYTITKESEVSTHIKGKYALYERIANYHDEFVEFARSAPSTSALHFLRNMLPIRSKLLSFIAR